MIASCLCGRRWRGLAQAHCPTCHAHFSSVSGFDRHRSTGRCADPATITDPHGRPHFKPVDSDWGRMWVRDDPRPHPQAAMRGAACAQDRLTGPPPTTDTPKAKRSSPGATGGVAS